MSVILVGNSDSVLNYELGNKIDEFDYVVRFNNCVLSEQYEPYIGKKITHRAMSQSHAKFCSLNNSYINLAFTQRASKNIKSYSTSKKAGVRVGVETYLDPEFDKKLIQLNLLQRKTASTGVYAINYFLKNRHDEVYIHGMCDWGNSHYWDLKFKVFQKHDTMNVDLNIINTLFKDRVKRLVNI